MDPLEHIKQKRIRKPRRTFVDEEERRQAIKARNNETNKSKICIGIENVSEWQRQKALCGLASSPTSSGTTEFVRHLLAVHQEHCALFNDAVRELGTEATASLEHNAAFAQQEAVRMSCISYTAPLTGYTAPLSGYTAPLTGYTAPLTSYTGPLTDVQTTTNDQYVTPQQTNNDTKGLPQWTVTTLPDEPQEVAAELPGLLDVTTKGEIQMLADEALAINEMEDVSEEAINEIKEVRDGDIRMETSNQEENLAPGEQVRSDAQVSPRGNVGGSQMTSRTKYHLCKPCNRTFSDKEIRPHLLSHLKGELNHCYLCVKGFPTKRQVEEHVLKHMGLNIDIMQLKHTTTVMPEDTDNRLTLYEVVKGKIVSPSYQPKNFKVSPLSTGDLPKRSYECTLCGESCKTWHDARQHSQAHDEATPYSCGMCAKYFSTTAQLSHHETNLCVKRPKPLYQCTTCKKVFKWKSILKNHESKHCNATFICDQCGYVTESHSNLRAHMYRHTGQWPFTCPQCGRGCPSKAQLSSHMAIHSDVLAHICPICGKGFRDRGYLRSHQVIHREDRPFKCRICEKPCKSNQRAKAHERSHTAQPKHECEVCGQNYKHKGQLNRHMLIHSSEGRQCKCTLCDKLFYTEHAVRRHMLTHTKDRPHECEVCGNRFQQRGHLRTHMMGHTGEWSHKCGLCGKGYGNPGHLSKHMADKHGST